jgi:predicted metal-dependent HD superfamily phosphohydrolase
VAELDDGALAARFAAALAAVGGRGAADAGALLAAWREPHRRYHTVAHLVDCLGWLDRAAAEAERPAELELALWFHDVVYRPLGPGDDEAASAALARRVLAGDGVPPPAIERIAALVLATCEHAPAGGDLGLMSDIDLSILGAPPAAFARYEAEVRAEWAAVDDEAFARGRLAVLERLRSRRPLFCSALLAAALTAQAVANLDGAIERWRRAAGG